MLNTLVVGAFLAFSPPQSLSRREAVTAAVSFAPLAALLAPLPAHAQRSALVPKSNAQSTASFKAYQLSQPGEATPEFLAAEKKRNENAALRAAGGTAKKETAEEEMARLGLRTMNSAVAAGYDECATWRGCRK